MPNFSLILPIYNAEKFLQSSLEKIGQFLNDHTQNSELILVLDGCNDNSLQICKEFAKHEHSRTVEILINETNRGKGFSVRRGMLQATGDYCIFTDCDLSYPVEEIDKVLTVLTGGAEVAIASRVMPGSTFTMSASYLRYIYTRHTAGRIFNWIIQKSLLPGIDDTQPGLKGFSGSAAKKIFSLQTLDGFSFDVEVLYIAQLLRFKIEGVPVNFHYYSEPTTVRFFQDTLKMLRDMVKIYINGLKGRYSVSISDSHE